MPPTALVRRGLIIVGVLAISAVTVALPYRIEYKQNIASADAEKQQATVYRMAGSPPLEKTYYSESKSPFDGAGTVQHVELNSSRLATEYALILILIGGGVVLARTGDKDE